MSEIYIYQVDVSYACFGLVVQDDVVVEAAPIAHWTVGKSFDFVEQYYKKQKKGKITEVRYDHE